MITPTAIKTMPRMLPAPVKTAAMMAPGPMISPRTQRSMQASRTEALEIAAALTGKAHTAEL